MKKLIIVIILFLIILSIWAYATYFHKPVAPSASPAASSTPTSGEPIKINIQKPGSAITASFIYMSSPGFVVVHEDNEGRPGKIIGNSKILPKGESQGVFVGLIRPVSSGETLYVMLHEDSGDGIFTPDIDIPIKDADGDPIMLKFYIGQ